MPLPDRRLVLRAAAARAAASRLVPRRLPRSAAAALLLSLSLPAHVGAGARSSGCRSPSSSVPWARVPAAAPRLRLLPPDAAPLSRAAAGARRRLSSSSTSRTRRSGAAPSRARWPASSPTPTASASRSSSWECWCGRGPTGEARGCPRRRSHSPPTPTATRCCGPGSRRLVCCSLDPAGRLRSGWKQAPLAPEPAAIGSQSRRFAFCARRAGARAAHRRLGLDDALRRRLDRPDDAPRLPAAAPAAVLVAACSVSGWLSCRLPGRRRPDARLLLLAFGALVGVGAGRGRTGARCHRRALRPARPALAGARGRGRPRRGAAALALADVAALGLVLIAVLWADGHSRVLRTGWTGTTPASRRRSCGRRGRSSTRACAAASPTRRVAVEYGPVHERAGSIRMYETLPHFSGRATLEGVYNQAATTTHPVYYLASELFARSPNPFRSRQLLALRPGERAAAAAALQRLRDRGREPGARLGARRAAGRRARGAASAVHALSAARTRARATSSRWRSLPCAPSPRGGATPATAGCPRKPANRALSCSRDDPRFDARGRPWAPPPERPLVGRRGARRRLASRPKRCRDHHEPAGPPAAGQDLLPPALARRGCGRPVPRLAGADARRPAAVRGAR